MKKSIYLLLIAVTLNICLFSNDFIYSALEEERPLAYCTVENLRVRSRPGTGYAIIGNLRYNEPVIILERDSKKRVVEGQEQYWYKIKRADGTVGWSYGAYLELYPLKEWNYLLFSRDYIFQQQGDNQDAPSYNFIDADTSVFMIVPANWKLDYSIFYDEEGAKCGELTPDGIVQSTLESSCYSSSKIKSAQDREETLNISDYRIKRFISESYHEDGTGVSGRWFSHNFCISRDDYHLGLVFYTKKKEQYTRLFEAIVRTVNFTVKLK